MKYILFSVLTGILFSCGSHSDTQNLEINTEPYADSLQQTTVVTKESEAGKTDAEVMVDVLVDVLGNNIAEKRKKDSAKFANREKVWVYQIGLAEKNEQQLWKVYDRIKSMGNIYAFKQSDDSYILIWNDFYTQEQLIDSLYHFNMRLSKAGVSDIAKPYDIMTDCKLKEKVVHTGGIKNSKKQVMPCLMCD
ncbi:hypothetical protein [Cytophaga hutchinsonii]|nr:hypothetical protein [Cytophaga hutchinsonii]SFX51383.1 hypothetical protein SAMN04487930_10552 [Cytophaga hutchinsonii ATCC 33406]